MQQRVQKLTELLSATETLVDELTKLFKEEFEKSLETHILQFGAEFSRLQNLSKVSNGLKELKEGVLGLADNN